MLTSSSPGNFEWGAGEFAGSAENITFSLEGGDGVPILRAELRDTEGNLVGRDLNLAERIGNKSGSFVFGGSPSFSRGREDNKLT